MRTSAQTKKVAKGCSCANGRLWKRTVERRRGAGALLTQTRWRSEACGIHRVWPLRSWRRRRRSRVRFSRWWRRNIVRNSAVRRGSAETSLCVFSRRAGEVRVFLGASASLIRTKFRRYWRRRGRRARSTVTCLVGFARKTGCTGAYGVLGRARAMRRRRCASLTR